MWNYILGQTVECLCAITCPAHSVGSLHDSPVINTCHMCSRLSFLNRLAHLKIILINNDYKLTVILTYKIAINFPDMYPSMLDAAMFKYWRIKTHHPKGSADISRLVLNLTDVAMAT